MQCYARSFLRSLANSTTPIAKSKSEPFNGTLITANSTRINTSKQVRTFKPRSTVATNPRITLPANFRSSSSHIYHKLSPDEIVKDLGNLTALFNQYNATELEGDLAAYISNITDILYEFNYNNSEFLSKLNYMINHEDYTNLTSLISDYNETEVELELKSGVSRVKKLVLFPDKEGENSYRNQIIIYCIGIIIVYFAILLLVCLLRVFGGFTQFVFHCIILPLRCFCPIKSDYKPLKTGGDDEFNANAELEDFEDEDTTIESDVHKIETVPLSEEEEFERMMTLNDGETSFDVMGKQIDDVIDAVASEFEMPPMGVSMEGDNSMDVERRRTKEFRF